MKHPRMKSAVNILLKTVFSVFHITHGVDATELYCGEGNKDGGNLPSDCWGPDHLHH